MAYKKSIAMRCRECNAKATFEVFNRYNSSVGFYCGRCVDAKVRELSGSERRSAFIETRGGTNGNG